MKICSWHIGLFWLGLFAYSTILPDRLWSFHHMAFLPKPIAFVVFSLASLSILTAFWIDRKSLKLRFPSRFLNKWTIASVGLLMGILFHFFPIVADTYGEAPNYAPWLHIKLDRLPAESYDWVFSFSLKPGDGRNTQLAIVSLFAYVTDATYESAFKWLDTIFGVLFVWTWLLGVRHFLTHPFWQFSWALAGICAPFMLIYFGHIDTYANVYLTMLVWLLLLLNQLTTKNKPLLWSLLFGLLVCIKLHPLTVMQAPIWCLAGVLTYDTENKLGSLFTYSGIAKYFFTPVFLVGFVLYFIVFEDHVDERTLRNIEDFDRLFLPIFSPDVPLDRYNLFSWNHIIDFVTVVLSWSPIAWFIISILLFVFYSKIDWKDNQILLLGTLVVLLTAFLFPINPLVSMPMDWDLFSLPVIPLLVLGLVLTQQIERKKIKPSLSMPIASIGIAVLLLPSFAVNASGQLLSPRIEAVGKHVFRTYYEHGREIIYFSQNMIPNQPIELLERKKTVVSNLEPYAVNGKDPSFATLLTDLGAHELFLLKDPRSALLSFEKGIEYYPNHRDNLLYQTQAYFLLEEYGSAYLIGEKLIKLNYPTRRKSLRMAIHLALEANLTVEAKKHAVSYLVENPGDQTIIRVKDGLDAGNDINELKKLFAR